MNHIEVTTRDGKKKTIFVDHSVYPQERLTFNELAMYHRIESKKKDGARVN